jgi:pimeloyl-ACP methyl ester carboxylesterase
MVDRGSGTPIVLIPGLQGRWEWTRPAVEALSKHHRVITYSLCDERTSPFPCDLAKGFDNYLDQLDAVLERARVDRAVIAGVSYGGLIAREFAARHPQRVSALVLASALHSSWEPNEQQRRFLNAPTLMSPLFMATAPRRSRPEMVAAFPSMASRLKFSLSAAARVLMAPANPSRMARRIAWAKSHRFADPQAVTAPVLLVTGEPELDRIVPVDVTRRYLDEFAEAEHVILKRTGHLGLVTRPDAFAGVLERFVNAARIPA